MKMGSNFRHIFRLFRYANSSTTIKQNLKLPLKESVLFASSAAYSSNTSSFTKAAVIIGGLGIGGGMYGYLAAPDRKNKHLSTNLIEKNDYSKNENIPDIIPSREVPGPVENLKIDFTLYQYQTCPFCCKVRAFLEFYGIPYKVVEVNPVMRQQVKFSTYKKVPILIAHDKESNQKHQLNDSTVIISILGTFFNNIEEGLQSVLPLYSPHAYKDEEGKDVEEVLNKYSLMYGEKLMKDKSDDYLKKEKHWRKWADAEFVHVLSPNIYRTYDEALQAFNYFSEVGEWEKNFSAIERLVVIYVGATAMYFIGKKLKKKYALKDDVRDSLYDACKTWMRGIGSKKKFMGGDLPNLADLAVYGMLSSIEGCVAFQDLLNNTNIGTWYYSVKESVTNHAGHQSQKI